MDIEEINSNVFDKIRQNISLQVSDQFSKFCEEEYTRQLTFFQLLYDAQNF